MVIAPRYTHPHPLLTSHCRVPYKVDGKPWIDKVKTDFKDAIIEFKQTLSTAGKEQNWSLSDLKSRFSNDLFDEIIFEDVASAKTAK